MGDVKLAEKFIEQKLGHEAVAEFRAYMKEARRAARKVARDKELATRPDLLRLQVDIKYTYGGDLCSRKVPNMSNTKAFLII